MSVLIWVLLLLPAAAGVLLCTAGGRANRAAAPVSLSASAVVLVLAIAAAVARPAVSVPFLAGAPFGLSVDALTVLILPAVAAVTFLVLVFAATEGTQAPARFHGLMLLFSAAVVLTLMATTLPALLFAWEIMGATSYALIGFSWREDHRVSAGLTAFLATRAADLGLYLAAGAALAGGAGLDLADLTSAPAGWRDLIAAGILLAALGKAAQLPFSFWLSRAMEGPSTVSALLHSAAMVAMGGYLLLRLSPLLQATGWAATTAAWAGALTALALGAVAAAQSDLKQLLAASTAAQLGFVVLGAGLGDVADGTAHLLAHAATKALLFLAAGAWLGALGTKQLDALRGAGRRWPLVGVSFAVGALSLAGIAPLSLWATKDGVLSAALDASSALYLTALAGSVLSAVYAGKALILVWRPRSPQADTLYDTEQRGTRHVGAWEKLPLVVLAAGAALLGVLALPPLAGVLRAALGQEGTGAAGGWEIAGDWEIAVWEFTVSALLALAVLALTARFRVPAPGWAAGWLGLEPAVHALVVRPVLGLSRGLARFDDAVLDRLTHRVARTVLQASARSFHFDQAGVDAAVRGAFRGVLITAAAGKRTDRAVAGAVGSLAARVRAAGALARLPQTGRLYQYYLQAAVVLVASAVLLILLR